MTTNLSREAKLALVRKVAPGFAPDIVTLPDGWLRRRGLKTIGESRDDLGEWYRSVLAYLGQHPFEAKEIAAAAARWRESLVDSTVYEVALSKRTLGLLKSFLNISPHWYQKAGNVLKTLAPTKDILAEAALDETFPRAFAIWDLARLLKAMKQAGVAVIKLHLDRLEVGGVSIPFSDPALITPNPYRDLKLPSEDAFFFLPKDAYADICKAAAALGVEDVVVAGDGKEDGRLTLKACDAAAGTASPSKTVEIGYYGEKPFQVRFKVAIFNKLMSGSYDVAVSKCFARFDSEADCEEDCRLTYFLAMA